VPVGVPVSAAEHNPTTGLEAVTRAYAKIVVEANGVDIKELREL
jgi:hypothetical protein